MRSVRWLVVGAVAASTSLVAVSQAGGAVTGKAAKGKPVVVMVMGSFTGAGLNFTSIPKAAQAAAAAINKTGGIDGRPIKVVSCDQGIDPNATGDCARKAADQKMVALVGVFTTDGDQYIPVLEKAGIPSVAPYAISFPEFTSKLSYPIGGGALSGLAGMGALLADNGAKKVDVAYLDIGAGKLAASFTDDGLKPRGAPASTNTPVPLNGADLAPSVAATLDKNPQGIALALTDPELSKWILAFRQAGGTAKLCVSGSALNAANLKALGKNANGIYVSNNYKPASLTKDPGVKRMLREVKAYDKKIQLVDPAIGAWAGVHLVANALRGAPTKDSAALVAALDQDKEWNLGIAAPVNFTKPNANVAALGIKRLFNLDVVYAQVKKGKVEAIKPDFVDPLAAG